MPKITYVDKNGTRHTLEVAKGLSVMRGAVDNSVPGILAECGGACACATCQVIVTKEWATKLPAPEAMELSMLDGAEQGETTRRLSCQITVTDALDGLVVQVPESQY